MIVIVIRFEQLLLNLILRNAKNPNSNDKIALNIINTLLSPSIALKSNAKNKSIIEKKNIEYFIRIINL